MEQNTDIKRVKIRHYQEVRLSESEFKNARELDSSELKSIRDEYFKRTFVYPLIGIIFSVVVAVLWFAGFIEKLYVFSDVITTVIMLLAASIIGMSAFWTVRCINSLTFVSKINQQDFYWHVGYITRRKSLWIIRFFCRDFYYLIDDKYCSRTVFDPFYRKGTEVYFLYFPGFMKSSYMGGIVVRKKHD